jgi:cell wall-associated NlpC family hydrolase
MPPPVAEDCSELVQNACDDAGVVPAMPDGAYYQWTHCVDHSTVLPSVEDGIATRGALLFVEDPFASSTFQTIPHVACSLGDGTTIEARGRAWGVGSFPAAGRFQHAALIPGVDYTPSPSFTPEVEVADHVCIPSWATRQPNARAYAYRLMPDGRRVVAYNQAPLRTTDGTLPDWLGGMPYTSLDFAAARGLDICEIESTGAVVVFCEDGGIIDIAAKP